MSITLQILNYHIEISMKKIGDQTENNVFKIIKMSTSIVWKFPVKFLIGYGWGYGWRLSQQFLTSSEWIHIHFLLTNNNFWIKKTTLETLWNWNEFFVDIVSVKA